MNNLKSSYARLAKLFKKSRDIWKERAQEKQEKLRANEIKIRDLTKSRDNWKNKTKELEKKVNDQEIEFSNFKKNLN